MSATLRVGFDMTPAGLHQGGVGRYTTDLAAALGRTPGVELHRLGTTGRGSGGFGKLAGRAERNLLYYPVMLDRQAASHHVDLVHCPGALVPLKLSRPLVLTIHDVLPWRLPELFSRSMLARRKVLLSRVRAGAAAGAGVLPGAGGRRGRLGPRHRAGARPAGPQRHPAGRGERR